MSMSIEKNHQT